MNRQYSNNAQTGKAKVIHTQLNSGYRAELAAVQDIKDPYLSIFSKVDALVLPEVLAMVARESGQTEVYRMLTAVVPDLASTVNRDAALVERIEERSKYKSNMNALKKEHEHQMSALAAGFAHSVQSMETRYESKVAALCAKNLILTEKLELIQSEREKKEWRRTNLVLSGIVSGMILLAWKGKEKR